MRVIGPPLSDDERAALIAFARSQVGVKFRHQRRQPGRYLDCLGLIACGLVLIGRTVADKDRYGREPHRDGLMEGLEQNLGPALSPSIPIEPGDVLAMRTAADPCHVALVADHPEGGLSIVHTSASFGRVIEQTLDECSRAYSIAAVFRP
jgi:hypothetical protein